MNAEQTALAWMGENTWWQPLMREMPAFINGEGPFLFRGDRLLLISYRAAWALLRHGLTTDTGQPVIFPTYSGAQISDEVVKSLSNHLHTIDG